MGLKRRLKRLEEVGQRGEAELSGEALRYLSDEELEALEDALEAGQEGGTATFEGLHCAVAERGRRALENLLECMEALREGREPRISLEAGEEGTRSRNGYRIWKYRNWRQKGLRMERYTLADHQAYVEAEENRKAAGELCQDLPLAPTTCRL